MMDEVKILKMSNGDLVIAEVVDEGRDVTSVINPFQLTERESDNEVIYFMDFWVPVDKRENLIGINRDHILATLPATEALLKYYNRVQEAMTDAGDKAELRYDDIEEDDDDELAGYITKPTLQ